MWKQSYSLGIFSTVCDNIKLSFHFYKTKEKTINLFRCMELRGLGTGRILEHRGLGTGRILELRGLGTGRILEHRGLGTGRILEQL